METFLEKLDRQLGRMIEAMDGQLQEPIVRTVTGEVYTHGTPVNGHDHHEPKPAENVRATFEGSKTTADHSADCPPVVRRANA